MPLSLSIRLKTHLLATLAPKEVLLGSLLLQRRIYSFKHQLSTTASLFPTSTPDGTLVRH